MLEFKRMLNHVGTQEFANHVYDVIDLVEDLGDTSIGSSFDNLLNQYDNTDSDHWLGDVEALVVGYLQKYLASQQVTATGTIPELTAILRGLSALSDVGESEYLYNTCCTSEDNESCLSELLEYVTGTSWLHFMAILDTVGDQLLDRLMDVYRPVNSIMVDSVDRSKNVELLKAFIARYNDLLIVDGIMGGLRLGGTVKCYIDAFTPELLVSAPERVAADLYAFGLAANLELGEIYAAVQPLVETFISDINAITKVCSNLRKLCEENNG